MEKEKLIVNKMMIRKKNNLTSKKRKLRQLQRQAYAAMKEKISTISCKPPKKT